MKKNSLSDFCVHNYLLTLRVNRFQSRNTAMIKAASSRASRATCLGLGYLALSQS